MRRSPGCSGRSIEVVDVSREVAKAKRWLTVLIIGLVCGWHLLGCGGPGSDSLPPVPRATLGPPTPAATIPVIVTPQAPLAPTPSHPPGEGVPRITFSELAYDFGDIPPTAPVAHTFTFTNTGAVDLIIQRVAAS